MEKVELLKYRIRSGEICNSLEDIQDPSFLSQEEAKALFLFLYDYTNSFKNANTSPDILKIAGRTLEFGIKHDRLIVDKMKQSLSQMRCCEMLIERLELFNEGAIAGLCIPYEIQKQGGVEVTENFMSNILITISGCLFGFVIIERNPGEFEVYLGSKYEKSPIEEIRTRLGLQKGDLTVRGKTLDEIMKIILNN